MRRPFRRPERFDKLTRRQLAGKMRANDARGGGVTAGRLLPAALATCLAAAAPSPARIGTVRGTGRAGFSGDGGPARQAQLRQPHSIQFDRAGDLYVCDIGNHRIRRVEMKTGLITTFAGTGEKLPTPDGARLEGTPLNGPRAIDFDRKG